MSSQQLERGATTANGFTFAWPTDFSDAEVDDDGTVWVVGSYEETFVGSAHSDGDPVIRKLPNVGILWHFDGDGVLLGRRLVDNDTGSRSFLRGIEQAADGTLFVTETYTAYYDDTVDPFVTTGQSSTQLLTFNGLTDPVEVGQFDGWPYSDLLALDDNNFWFGSQSSTILKYTGTATPPVDSPVPLVVLHGITGSYLENSGGSEIWPNTTNTALDLDDDDLDSLELASNGIDPMNPGDEISVSTGRGLAGFILETEACALSFCQDAGKPYKPMFDMFSDEYGYAFGDDLFPFAFDWRRSAEYNGERLLDFIETVLAVTGASQVNIIAHSQGGLVTRSALGSERSIGMVQRVTTLGTPVLGAPKLFGVLELGEPCQAVAPVNGCFLSRGMAQRLTTNWPGALELLPSKAYFDSYESSVLREIDDDGDGEYEGFLSFAEVRSQLTDRNIALIDQATNFHLDNDVWNPADPDVKLLRIIGSKSDTIVRVRQFIGPVCVQSRWSGNSCIDKEMFEFEMGDGDGTVPIGSASAFDLGISPGVKLCTVSGEGRGHGELPNDERVIEIALEFMENNNLVCGETNGANQRSAAGLVDFARSESAGPPSADFRSTELLVRGPATGYLERVGTDPQQVMGVVPGTGPVEFGSISGGLFTTASISVSFAVAAPGSYDARLVPTGSGGELQLFLRTYEDTIVEVLGTGLFVVEEDAEISIGFTSPLLSDIPSALIDDDGDGTIDRTIGFTEVTSGAAAADRNQPVSVITTTHRIVDGLPVVDILIEATDEGVAGYPESTTLLSLVMSPLFMMGHSLCLLKGFFMCG